MYYNDAITLSESTFSFPIYIMVETSMKLSVFTISTGQTDVKMKPRFFISVLILNRIFIVIRRVVCQNIS